MKGITRALFLLATAPVALSAQNLLDQFSYEGLVFSGIGLEVGGVASDRLTSEWIGGVRVDYGFFAPNVRLMLGANYFKGDFDGDEIVEFEQRLGAVVTDPENNATVDVGLITWTNIAVEADLQYVVRGALRPYGGVGVGVHFRNGAGSAIDGTFVEDALDTIAAALNLSGGLELSVLASLDVYADLRASVSSELSSASARLGFMYRPTRGTR